MRSDLSALQSSCLSFVPFDMDKEKPADVPLANYETLCDSNALFFYQPLQNNRLPSMDCVRDSELTRAQRFECVASRMARSWLFRLAAEGSPASETYHNLFGVYVLWNTAEGNDAYRRMLETETCYEEMPTHSAVAGVLWCMRALDKGDSAPPPAKGKRPPPKKRKRRADDAESGEDDEAEAEEEKLTVASRVVMQLESERRALAPTWKAKSETKSKLLRLASGLSESSSAPFDLSSNGDFALLVGMPQALHYLELLARDGATLDGGAWYRPEDFFTFENAQRAFPPGVFIPRNVVSPDGKHVSIVRPNVWSVNARAAVNSEVAFYSALFPMVAHCSGGQLVSKRRTISLHDPLSKSRARSDGLWPAAMSNIRAGYEEKERELRDRRFAGYTHDEAAALLYEHIHTKAETGALDPSAEGFEETHATNIARLEHIEREYAAYSALFGIRMRRLKRMGLELVVNALTPAPMAPLSTSSMELSRHLESIRARIAENQDTLHDHWVPCSFRFEGASTHSQSFLRMSHVMDLQNMYTNHCTMWHLTLAGAIMPWSSEGGMPLNIMLLGPPGKGKSFALDLLKDFTFPGLWSAMDASSEKCMFNPPHSRCCEGFLAGRCILMEDFQAEQFNPDSQRFGRFAGFLKTQLTGQSMGNVRTEKDEATGAFYTAQYNLTNHSVMIVAGNKDISDAPLIDRFVRLISPDIKRADNLSISDLNYDSAPAVKERQNHEKRRYRMVSVTAGVYHHAVAAGVLALSTSNSFKLHEERYIKRMLPYGAQKFSSRASAIGERMSKHGALFSAIEAVFCGGNESSAMAFPADPDALMHAEAVAMVPGDNEQFLHFSALRTKNFDPHTRIALQAIAWCVFGLNVGDEVNWDEMPIIRPSKTVGIFSEGEPPEQCDTRRLLIPRLERFRMEELPTNINVSSDLFTFRYHGRSQLESASVFLANSIITFLHEYDTEERFPRHETTIHNAFKSLIGDANGGPRPLGFHQLDGENGYALAISKDQLQKALIADVECTVIRDMFHSATPVGTILLANPQVEKEGVTGQKASCYPEKPTSLCCNAHDPSCALYQMPGYDVDDDVRQLMRRGDLVGGLYCAERWQRLGCDCYRSKLISARNPSYVSKSKQSLGVRVPDYQKRYVKDMRVDVRFPAEELDFVLGMHHIGLNPFDPDVRKKYHPRENRPYWYPDSVPAWPCETP